MFGFGKSKSEKIALKIERILMSMEAAADKGRWDTAVYCSQQLNQSLRKLNLETDWTERDLTEFLVKRNLVKQVKDPNYKEWLLDNMPPHLG